MALTVVSAYPAVDEQGLPLMTSVTVEFSEAIDVDSINTGTFIVATLAKNVVHTGPLIHNWAGLLPSESLSGDLLRSPSFDGILEGDYTFSQDLKTVTFGPHHPMNPNVNHVVILSKNILTRTIGPVTPGGYAPPQGTGVVELAGPYTGEINDAITIRVLASGNLSTGTFIYWFNSDPFTVSSPITIDRVIRLEKGLIARFAEGQYVAGDTFYAELWPGVPLESLYSWGFSTGDGSLVEPPVEEKSVSLIGANITGFDSSNTPPAISTITYIGASPDDDGGGDVPITTRHFIIEFTKALDPLTVTDDTITIYRIGLSSYNDRAGTPLELTKTLTLSGKILDVQLAAGSPIGENQEIVFLLSGIKDTDGVAMSRTTTSVTTRFNPYYTTASRIRLEIGPFITTIPSGTLNRLIYNHSVEASVLNFTNTNRDSDEWFKFITSEYVVCSVIKDLMDTVLGAGGPTSKNKTLGDLRVGYRDTGKGISPKDTRDKAGKCADTLKPMIQNGGNAYIQPINVIKGYYDDNRPAFGRGYLRVENNQLPIGNVNEVIFRRYYKTGVEPTESGINNAEDALNNSGE